jgi:Zn-dependent peptidase ImmA (M78 family)/transcriptional regulator with XRE-family HTH domain
MNRVDVAPEMLRWAAGRAGFAMQTLSQRFPRLLDWERGAARPTLKQLESFAKATHTPIGYLFLQEPPEERVPIPDFRTLANVRRGRPSPDLLDTIYLCQQRQEWFREFARTEGRPPLPFVGSAKLESSIEGTAATMRAALRFDLDERRQMPTWTEALRRFIGQADGLGVLVMVSGVVGSNNSRKLDPQEFRGFALSDPVAPLIFINGADTKAAQMFTLAHELAHLWLGQSAVSDAQASLLPENQVERWCNQIAAELLVPLSSVRAEYRMRADLRAETDRLAQRFKVSTLVILRRMYDAGGLTREAFWETYNARLRELHAMPRSSGGDFYLTLGARVSKRFARALVTSAVEGRSSFSEALRLLGFKKMTTFRELAQSLGVAF